MKLSGYLSNMIDDINAFGYFNQVPWTKNALQSLIKKCHYLAKYKTDVLNYIKYFF